MTNPLVAVTLVSAAAVLAGTIAGFAQMSSPPIPAAQPPIAANAPPVPYTPTMGDLMNTLVQPRHAKLGLAGNAQNWPLAGYALREIRQAVAVIGKAIPRWRGLPVPDLFDAALSESLKELQTAIQQQEPEKFTAAYGTLTRGCNACHATVDHPFVVIKTPDASAFPNQEFGARR